MRSGENAFPLHRLWRKLVWRLWVLKLSWHQLRNKLLFPSPQKPILYSSEVRDKRQRGHESLRECCQRTDWCWCGWEGRMWGEWKTNGKRAYFFKGVRHHSSGFPSCLGSHMAVLALRTVLEHFLCNTHTLERRRRGTGEMVCKNKKDERKVKQSK